MILYNISLLKFYPDAKMLTETILTVWHEMKTKTNNNQHLGLKDSYDIEIKRNITINDRDKCIYLNLNTRKKRKNQNEKKGIIKKTNKIDCLFI